MCVIIDGNYVFYSTKFPKWMLIHAALDKDDSLIGEDRFSYCEMSCLLIKDKKVGIKIKMVLNARKIKFCQLMVWCWLVTGHLLTPCWHIHHLKTKKYMMPTLTSLATPHIVLITTLWEFLVFHLFIMMTLIFQCSHCINTLVHDDTMAHRNCSTLVQLMAWCLTAPSHYLN